MGGIESTVNVRNYKIANATVDVRNKKIANATLDVRNYKIANATVDVRNMVWLEEDGVARRVMQTLLILQNVR